MSLVVEFLPFSSAVLKYSVGGMRGNKLGTSAGLSSLSFSTTSDIGSAILQSENHIYSYEQNINSIMLEVSFPNLKHSLSQSNRSKNNTN